MRLREFHREVDGRHGIALRRLIQLLHDLKIKHGVQRLQMDRIAGKKTYQLNVFTK